MTWDYVRQELERTLRNLAAPAAEQTSYLTRLGTAPSVDELALEFDDVFRRLTDSGLHTKLGQAKESVAAVNRMLADISGEFHEQLWTTAALERRAEWTRIRELATKALMDLVNGR